MLALALLLMAGCKSSQSSEETRPDPVSVRAAPVTGGQTEGLTLRFSGIVRATQRATLTFQVSGTLRERAVELGQEVRAGDLLARVYSPALEPARDSARARLEELNAQYEQALREYRRSSRLRERGMVSQQALEQLAARRDSLRASVATAEASLAEASRLLEESDLRAPFDGRVEAILVENDEYVASGQPVIRLSSPRGREVEVRLPAYLLTHAFPGQGVPVWPVHDRTRPAENGTIVEVAQASGRRGELHPVLVNLPVNTLQPGEPVEVGITPQETADTTVPLVSVMKSLGGASVFRIRDGLAERVPVTVQRVIGERVVVYSDDLAADDQVIYAGMTRITHGDPVEAR